MDAQNSLYYQNMAQLSLCFASYVREIRSNSLFLSALKDTLWPFEKSQIFSYTQGNSLELSDCSGDSSDATTSSPIKEADKETSENESRFQCQWEECTMSFMTRTSLATHASTHLTEYYQVVEGGQKRRARLVCKWKGCSHVVGNVKELVRHLSDERHIGQTPFVPKTDNSGPPQKKRKGNYQCELCGKHFSDPSNKRKHERIHDANRERFFCSEKGCNKSYSTRTDLNIHLKVHRGQLEHICSYPDCRKAFVRLSELYAHERSHDKMLPHACSCGKRFRERSKLYKHQIVSKCEVALDYSPPVFVLKQ